MKMLMHVRSTLMGQSEGWASSPVVSDDDHQQMLRKSVWKPEQIYSDRALYDFSTSSNQQFKKFLSWAHLGYDV